MTRYQYTVHITRFLMLSAVVCLFGGILTVKGLFGLYHRSHVKISLYNDKIHAGEYVRFDISLAQVVGNYYEEANGEKRYGPVCTSDVWTSDRYYVMATDEGRMNYIVVRMSDEQRRGFEQFLDSREGTYQIFGRVEKLKYHPPYDVVAERIGVDSAKQAERMISKKYEVRVVSPDSRESMWYKGLIVLALGLCGVWSGIERRSKDT